MAWSASSDLDRGHAHRRGGLEVDAEVVEEDALGGLDGEQFAGDLVEARFGFAHADLARLDDLIEARHDVGDVGAWVAADHVVGETRGEKAGLLHAVQRHHHLRADVARQQREHVGAGDAMAERLGFGREPGVELDRADRVPFEVCPRVVVRIRGVHRPEERVRQAVRALVSGERFEGAGENHAAEVPEYRSDHDRPSLRWVAADPSRSRLDVANARRGRIRRGHPGSCFTSGTRKVK